MPCAPPEFQTYIAIKSLVIIISSVLSVNKDFIIFGKKKKKHIF